MGYQLRRALREALGSGITGLQRAVALEIADDANDTTRKSFVDLENLVRWTGAKDTAVIRNALKRLAAAGWEFRVPIGQGKDGRVLYAVPGKKMTFMVPAFTTEGGASATPSGSQGVAPAHSEGAGAHSEGAGATPFSSFPSVPSSSEPGTVAQPTPRPEEEEESSKNDSTDGVLPDQLTSRELAAASIVVSRLANAPGGPPTPEEVPSVLEHIRNEAAKNGTTIAAIDVWVNRRDLGTLKRDLASVRSRHHPGGSQKRASGSCAIHSGEDLPCLSCKGDLSGGGPEAQAVIDLYLADPGARPDLKGNRYIQRALEAAA